MSAATDAAKTSLQSYKALGSDVALNKANTQYDVGGSQTRLSALKGIVGNLQSSVEAVDPSVTGRTSGTFTTEGQRQALVAKERQPILGELGKEQNALTSEQGDLTQKQTLASQMATALLSDDKAKYQRLLDQYNASTAQDTAAEQKRQYETSLAEQRRQFDVTAAQNARNAAAASASKSGGGGSSQETPAQQASAALTAKTGDDGYTNPGAYNSVKSQWISSGYGSATQFDQSFARFRNPKDRGYRLE